MLTALVSLSLSTVGAPLPQQPNGSVLDVVPLQHVCGTRTGFTPPPWGSLLRWSSGDGRPDLLRVREVEGLSTDSAAELLQRLYVDDLEHGRLAIETDAAGLLLLGDGALVARVRDDVRQLSQALLRPLQIEAAVWEAAAGEAPPAVLAPGDWRRWFADREPVWRSTATTQVERAVALDGQRWTRYVRDNDVEVAQKQSVSVPITDAFGVGGRVVVVPHGLLGGDDLALHVQFAFGTRRGAVRSVSTGIPGQSDIELPVLETNFGACSARVANGGGIAITLRGDASAGGNFVLTVRATSPTPPPALTVAGVSVLPCGALTSDALTDRIMPPSPYPNGEDVWDLTSPEVDEMGAGSGHLDRDRLLDLLRTALGEAAEVEEFDLLEGAGHLFVLGTDASRTKVAELLEALQTRMVRNVELQHRARLGTADDGALLHELIVPSLVGREATVARLLETPSIDRLWVEIAQEAAVHNPEVTTLQLGAWVRMRAAPQDQQLHVQLLAQCVQAPLPQVRNVVPSGGNLMPTDVSSTRVVHDGAVPNGQALDQGDGPTSFVHGQPTRTVLSARFRW